MSATLFVAVAGCSSSSGTPETIPASPAPVPWHNQAEASPSLANHLLHASDLGAGWYDGFTPVDPTLPSLPAGGRAGAMTMVSKAHRTSQGWTSDVQVWERAVDFDSVAAARAYVAGAARGGGTSSPADPPDGFVIGTRGYLVRTMVFRHPAPGRSDLYRNAAVAERMLRAAEHRARTGA